MQETSMKADVRYPPDHPHFAGLTKAEARDMVRRVFESDPDTYVQLPDGRWMLRDAYEKEYGRH
jgi:hypothetical protein